MGRALNASPTGQIDTWPCSRNWFGRRCRRSAKPAEQPRLPRVIGMSRERSFVASPQARVPDRDAPLVVRDPFERVLLSGVSK